MTTTVIELPTVPYIKWLGGKRLLIPKIREFWQPHDDRRLVDLTVGAGAIPIGLQPKRALLNDINPHLVNLHQWVKQGFDLNGFSCENTALAFAARKADFNQSIALNQINTKRQAQAFYYLLKTCFNGLCRFNSSGQFNTAYGKYKDSPDRYKTDFSDYQELFRNWDFVCGDFEAVAIAPDDFIFADPPYDSQSDSEQLGLLGAEFAPSTGKGFVGYFANGFSWADQVRLARLLANHPGPSIAFNAATDRIVGLYEGLGFEVVRHQVRRSISCNGDRTAADEVMLLRNV